MIPRNVLFGLALAIPVLLVTFAVVMSFQMILAATGDVTGASVAKGIGIAALVLLVIDLILITWLLAVQALNTRTDEPYSDPLADFEAEETEE